MPKIKAKKIALIHVSGRIGDTLFITSLINTLKKNYPQSQITVYLHRNTIDLLENNDEIYKLCVISSKKAIFKGWLSRKRYDLSIVSYSPDEEADNLKGFALRVSRKVVSFSEKNSKFKGRLTYVAKKDFSEDRHIINYYHALTDSIGLKRGDLRVHYYSSKKEIVEIEKIISDSSLKDCQEIIGVKITSLASRSYRNWPEKNLISLLKKIKNAYPNFGFIFFGDMHEYELYDRLGIEAKVNFFNASEFSMRQIGAMGQKLDCYIGVDTGVTHLISSLNIPLILLYHPDSPSSKYAPLNHPNLVIEMADNTRNTEKAMEHIKPQKVFEIFKGIFKES